MPENSLIILAGRCEAAEGPDRELGREVLRACGWTQSTHGYFLGPLTGWTAPDRAIYFDDDDFVRCKHDPTASIDAAMTLVPVGTQWTLTTDGPRFLAHANGFTASAATPALASCAAALRARAVRPPAHVDEVDAPR